MRLHSEPCGQVTSLARIFKAQKGRSQLASQGFPAFLGQSKPALPSFPAMISVKKRASASVPLWGLLSILETLQIPNDDAWGLKELKHLKIIHSN